MTGHSVIQLSDYLRIGNVIEVIGLHAERAAASSAGRLSHGALDER